MPASSEQMMKAMNFVAAHVVAGKPRHLGVAADRIELPAERAMAHHVDEGDEEHERDQRRVGHVPSRRPLPIW